LISDSTLRNLTRDLLSPIFELTFKLFTSSLFPVRNCAGMVFSSLVNRVFGNSITHTNSLDSNTNEKYITAMEFFLRFPYLYPVLLQGLKNEGVVYPILVIFSRLRGSGKPLTTEENGNNSLEKYPIIPIIDSLLESCKSKEWKVREMAARAIAAVIDPSEAHFYISNSS
jgi:hypothetical protein